MNCSSSTMGIFERFQQINTWGNTNLDNNNDNNNNFLQTDSSTVVQVKVKLDDNIKANYVSSQSADAEPFSNDPDESGTGNKMQRRLAQNREAARKSRLRKKAYVQQLEESRLKLAQLEQELQRARQQGLYVGGRGSLSDASYLGSSGSLNTGIAAFEMEYANWLEEEHKLIRELRNALQIHVSDIELRMLVETCLIHYGNLFRIKADAARTDVFYVMSGMWRTSTERFFQWIGGFRPSELLNVVMPHLEPLSDHQLFEVRDLQQSSQQAEDALSQGIDKLQQSLAENVVVELASNAIYGSHMAAAVENLQALEGFLKQADHLRQQNLIRMSKILTIRQSARGLLVLGQYFHRLRALSSLWSARPREPS